MVHRAYIYSNCSDNVKDDQIFKDTLIEYKAYLMKSGYEEEYIDKIFVTSDLLRPSGERINKERSKQIRKYRMVVDYEPTFSDIHTAFRKFRSIMEEDEELKVIFPKGIKHLQVSERRSTKNIKEILELSTFAFHPPQTETSENNFEMSKDLNENSCFPYGKGCVLCFACKAPGKYGEKYQQWEKVQDQTENKL